MEIKSSHGKSSRILSVILAVLLCGSVMASCSQETIESQDESEESVSDTASETIGLEDPDLGYDMTAVKLYVDCNAEVSGDGSETSPFKTIQEADAKITGIKNGEGLPMGGITVVIRSGEYNSASGINLTCGGGTEESPIVFMSEEEYGAVLTSGTTLNADDFEPLTDEEKSRIIDKDAAENVVKIDLTKYGMTADDWGTLYSTGLYGTGKWYDGGSGENAAELFFNGERMTLARYPNEGWTRVGDVLGEGDSLDLLAESQENGWELAGPTFVVSEDVTERLKQYQSFDDIWTFGYFMFEWADASNPVAKVSSSRQFITLDQFVWYGIDEGKKYYLFNIFEELDYPGEYYIDRENGIMYFYAPDELENSQITFTNYNATIIGATASYLTLEGLTVAGGGGNGIYVGGDHITVDNCKISGVRGIGVDISGTDITLRNSEVFSAGSNGIRVSGGDKETITKSNILIYNNFIHDWGEVERTCFDGISISGCGTTVSHNEIANGPHTAIGWNGPYHVIEYNELYNVCYESSDCGAMYAGRNFVSYGSVVRYNYIHEVGYEGSLAIGIYLDDGMSGQTVYGNIVENPACFGIMIGGGRDNQVYNNIIINSPQQAIYYDSRMRDGEFDGGWYGPMAPRGTQFTDIQTICQNEYWTAQFPVLSDVVIDPSVTDRDDPLLACNPANSYVANNVLYRTIETDYEAFFFDTAPQTFSEIHDNCLIDDLSDFADAENGDYTMIENPAVKELIADFEEIPFDEIGRVD